MSAALLLDVKQVAQALALSERTVWRLVSIGELPRPLKIGRATRWRLADLQRWTDRLKR